MINVYNCLFLISDLEDSDRVEEWSGRGILKPRVRGGSKRVDNFKVSRLLSDIGLRLQYPDYKRYLFFFHYFVFIR